MKSKPSMIERKDAARALGITIRTLSRFVAEGKLKPIVIRKRGFFLRADVEALKKK